MASAAQVNFATMIEPSLAGQVEAMMRSLYAEDPASAAVNPDRFIETVRFLLASPQRGRIILITSSNLLVGYAILIPWWSNEFGGTLLVVDELFVVPESRGQGIGRRFFEFLAASKPYDAVALALEVSPVNSRAAAFYKSLGFEPRQHKMLTRKI